MNLGIFGGTFDPPHIGHLILAAEALDQLVLERVLFVLTPNPPHKASQPITPLTDRLGMLQAALAEAPAFKLSHVDIDRPPPHYAVGSLRTIREKHPEATLTYLMGGDSLADLPTWHAAKEFVLACDAIGVMLRPGRVVDLQALESQLPGIASRVRFIQAPLLDISSSRLRERMANGRPFRYYLPDPVYRIILERGLYGVKQSEAGRV